jgi:hypothetical protein
LITADLIHSAAKLVFRLLFKVIAAEADDGRRALLNRLFAAIAEAPPLFNGAMSCLEAACDLFMQLMHIRKPPFVHVITHIFLCRLDVIVRLLAFQILFSDAIFLRSLMRPPIEPSATAPYPYIPFFSLYRVFTRLGNP